MPPHTAPPQEPALPLLAFDIGGTHLRGLLARPTGEPLGRLRWPTDRERTAEQVCAAVAELLAPTPFEAPAALVVGVPGVVRGEEVSEVPNVPALQGVGFARTLRSRLRAPLRLVNDANLAALAERRAEADLVFLALGTGLGCGVLVGGQVYAGAAGRAGELGLLPYPSAVGAVLEDLLSGPGLARLARQLGGPIDVGAALDDPGPAGQALRAALAGALEYLLRVVGLCYDPGELVVGGGLGLRLISEVEAAARAAGLGVRVRPALHGDDAALQGGLRLARELAAKVPLGTEVPIRRAP